jgi:outer membrane protein assembly factor BamD (BamD/ComL family)
MQRRRNQPDSQPDSQPASPPAVALQGDESSVIAEMTTDKQARIVRDLRTIVRLYGQSPTGQQAAGLLTELERDTRIMEAVSQWKDDEVVRKLFEKAQMYHKAKMFEQAARYYQELLDKYGDSQYAEKAGQNLAAVQAILLTTPRKQP